MRIKNKIIWMFNLDTVCGLCGGEAKGRSRGRINGDTIICNECTGRLFKQVMESYLNQEVWFCKGW